MPVSTFEDAIRIGTMGQNGSTPSTQPSGVGVNQTENKKRIEPKLEKTLDSPTPVSPTTTGVIPPTVGTTGPVETFNPSSKITEAEQLKQDATYTDTPPGMLSGGPPEVNRDATPTPISGAQGVAEDNKSGLGYVDQAQSLVEGRLGNLLSSDNPYIAQARSRAEETAAGRGMLNSSIAGRAGEEAAIRAGIEIASQDAGTMAAAQEREQTGDINQTQTQLEGSITRTLQDAGYESKEVLQDMVNQGNQDAIALQGQINKQRDVFAAREATKLTELQGQIQTTLKQMGIDGQAADRYSSTLGTLTNTLMNNANSVVQNMDIGDVTAAMGTLQSFASDMELMKGIFDSDFSLI